MDSAPSGSQPSAARPPPAPAAPRGPPPTLQQVLVLQAALAELRGHPVAGPLAALGGMAPGDLHRQIRGSTLDMREVVGKLARAMAPDRAAATLAAYEAAAAPPPAPAPRPPAAAEEAESVEDMARRIKPGTLKRMMFEVLVDKSDAAGMSVGEIYEEMERRGQVSAWADEKTARSAISSACSADPGLLRLRQGVFAIKARVPCELLERAASEGGGRRGGLASGSASPAPPPVAAAAAAAGAGGGGGAAGGGGPITVQRAAAARRTPTVVRAPAARPEPPPRQAFARNEHACAACRAAYHPSFSPLLLCDFCPRAYHVVCLSLDWADLPEGEWACPGCAQLGHAPGVSADALARQQQLAAEARERERRRQEVFTALEASRAHELRPAAPLGGRGRGRGAAAAGAPSDDLDVAEEEAGEAARLAALLPVLKEEAVRERGGGGGGRWGSGGRDRDEWTPRTAGDQLREAQSRLARLKATSSGPPEFEPAVESEQALASLLDMLAIAEFLAAFGPVLGAPVMDLRQLSEAAAWPCDGEGELVAAYAALLRFLLAQWSQVVGGHTATRVKRWARCLDRSTGGGSQEGLADGRCGAAWQELLRRYCLLTRSATPVTDAVLSERDWALMSDDMIAVHAAVEIGRGSVLRLGPAFHVRLLAALVNDVASSFALRNEVNKRLESTIQQQIHQYHANAERRKAEREAARQRREAKRARQQAAAAAAAAAVAKAAARAAAEGGGGGGGGEGVAAEAAAGADDGGGEDEPPAKRARSGSTGGQAPAQQQQQQPAASRGASTAGGESGDDDDEDEDDKGACAARLAELGRASIRSEPLGHDRLHRRYWLLPTHGGAIFQESADGRFLGIITAPDQLDALLRALNPRGPREAALLAVLRRRQDELAAELRPPDHPLDVTKVPRPAAPSGGERRRQQQQEGGAGEGQQQRQQQQKLEPYEKVLADAELESVRSCVGELEAVMAQLMGVGVPGVSHKAWRRRLAATTTTQQLFESILDLERDLQSLGEGLPPGADDASLEPLVREAELYEAEFVLPVSEAEARAARAAAADAADAAAAGEEEGREEEARAAAEAAAAAAAAAKKGANKKGKKGGGGGAKGKKGGGGGGKGGKAGGAVAESEFGVEGDEGQQLGPALLLGGGRVRLKPAAVAANAAIIACAQPAAAAAAAGAVKAEPAAGGAVKPEGGGGGGADEEGGGGGGEGEGEGGEDARKLVAPLEELDDSDIEAEERYRIKRQHEKAGEPVPPPPLRLWRSPRERAAWLRDARRALIGGSPGGMAYCASALVDRATRLIRDWPLGMKPYNWLHAADCAAARRRRRVALLGAARVLDEEWAAWEEEEEELRPAKPKKSDHFQILDLDAGRGQRTAARRLKELLQQEGEGEEEEPSPPPERKPSAARSGSAGGGKRRSGARSGGGRKGGGGARGRKGSAAAEGSGSDGGSSGGEEAAGSGEQGGGASEGEAEALVPAGPQGSLPEDERLTHVCIACEMTGDMMACECPGCPTAMHPECAGFSLLQAPEWRCPDHAADARPAWRHAACAPLALAPPGARASRAPRAPPVRRFVL